MVGVWWEKTSSTLPLGRCRAQKCDFNVRSKLLILSPQNLVLVFPQPGSQKCRARCFVAVGVAKQVGIR